MSQSLLITILLLFVASAVSLPLSARMPRREPPTCSVSISQSQNVWCTRDALAEAVEELEVTIAEELDESLCRPAQPYETLEEKYLALINYTQQLSLVPNRTDSINQVLALLNMTLVNISPEITGAGSGSVEVSQLFDKLYGSQCILIVIDSLYLEFIHDDIFNGCCSVCKRLNSTGVCDLVHHYTDLEVYNNNVNNDSQPQECRIDHSLNYLGQTLVMEQAIAALLNGSYNVSEEVIQLLTGVNDSLPAIRDSLEKECECTRTRAHVCNYDTSTQVDTINELQCTETGKRLCLVNVIAEYFMDLYDHLRRESIIPYLELEGGECITARLRNL